MTRDHWLENVKLAWLNACRDGVPQASWVVRDSRHPGAFAVETYMGVHVIRTRNKALAELIAMLPELCDEAYRPGEAVRNVDGRDIAIGTTTVQEAFDAGYEDGFTRGFSAAEEELDETINADDDNSDNKESA